MDLSIKYVFSVGCSFVDGSEGLTREQTFTYKVAQQLDSKWNNYGTSGGCNDMITRRTFDYLTMTKNYWPEMLVLIGWTNHLRVEFFPNEHKVENHYEMQNHWTPMYNIIDQYEQIHGVEPKGKWFEEIHKFYYTKIWDKYEMIKKGLTNQVMLQSFLQHNNIKYLMWNSLSHSRGEGHNSKLGDYIVNHPLQKHLDERYWVFPKESSWEDNLTHEERVSELDHHPSEKGNDKITRIIMEKVNKIWG